MSTTSPRKRPPRCRGSEPDRGGRAAATARRDGQRHHDERQPAATIHTTRQPPCSALPVTGGAGRDPSPSQTWVKMAGGHWSREQANRVDSWRREGSHGRADRGGRRAVEGVRWRDRRRDLSFTVNHGQVYGLLGPNGAGKTTTFRVLMGLERPNEGETQLFGSRVARMRHHSAGRSHGGGGGVRAAPVGNAEPRLWWEAGGARMADADLDGALGIAGLGDAIDRRVSTYCQGMKQRLGFARLLLSRPELLVLDEPTNGLDPGEIREIRQLIGRLSNRGRPCCCRATISARSSRSATTCS